MMSSERRLAALVHAPPLLAGATAGVVARAQPSRSGSASGAAAPAQDAAELGALRSTQDAGVWVF